MSRGGRTMGKTRTEMATSRLNFETPIELLRGVKIAAALGDTTIRLTVVQVLDEWLLAHPELSRFEYEPVELGWGERLRISASGPEQGG